MRRSLAVLTTSAVVLAACGGAGGVAPTSSSSASGAPTTLHIDGLTSPDFTTDIDGAVAMNLAGNGEEWPKVVWTTAESVLAADLDLATGDLAGQIDVAPGVTPIAHSIERPAVAVHADGSVDIAFTSLRDGGNASVFLTEDGSEPEPISGEPQPETNLVHMTLVDGSVVLAWLEDSTLSVGAESDGVVVEMERVDDLTCDCCNPVPLAIADSVVVAYRDFDEVDGQIVRNAAAVRSGDGLESFADPVPIADDDWFISGCPFSGPSVIAVGDDLIVAWMDGRQSVHPDQSSTSIWVDRSHDGGLSFGADLEITGVGINRWPVMAVESDGTVHLVWETAGLNGGLSYASSSDAGQSFVNRGLLVARSPDDGGAPKSPSVLVDHDHLVVTWTDSTGGHVSAWSLGG